MPDPGQPGAFSPRDLRALRRRDGAAVDAEALVRLAPVQRMFENSLTVAHTESGNHLLGACCEWSPGPDGAPGMHEVNVGPNGQQTFKNFQLLTLWYRQTQVDANIRLTNNADYACFYEVYLRTENGFNSVLPFVNPWPQASTVYPIEVGQKLIVTPVGMVRYMLAHDPKLACLDVHAPAQEATA
jgi:hypothetical protein